MNLNSYASEIEDIQPGETIRVDHGTLCSAGEETRRRLYITRTLADPEVVIGYCHNCAEGGKYTDAKYTQYRNELHDTPPRPSIQKVFSLSPPKNMVHTLTEWPVHAQAWAMKNKLTQQDLDTYSIQHDTASNRVYLPRHKEVLCNIHAGGNVLRGYQLRLTQGKGPKYTTVIGDKDEGFTVLRPYHGAPETKVVVVEDLVSGIHIINANLPTDDVCVLVNYGVKINPLTIPTLNEFDDVIVWLDNDSDYVEDQAKKLCRTVNLYGSARAHLVEHYEDPKHYRAQEIMGVINGFN